MNQEFEYLTQRQLGEKFGVSSHQIGKWLVEVGLRTGEKKPSGKAFSGGFVTQAETPRGFGYFYVWHREKTVRALEAAGYQQL